MTRIDAMREFIRVSDLDSTATQPQLNRNPTPTPTETQPQPDRNLTTTYPHTIGDICAAADLTPPGAKKVLIPLLLEIEPGCRHVLSADKRGEIFGYTSRALELARSYGDRPTGQTPKQWAAAQGNQAQPVVVEVVSDGAIALYRQQSSALATANSTDIEAAIELTWANAAHFAEMSDAEDQAVISAAKAKAIRHHTLGQQAYTATRQELAQEGAIAKKTLGTA